MPQSGRVSGNKHGLDMFWWHATIPVANRPIQATPALGRHLLREQLPAIAAF